MFSNTKQTILTDVIQQRFDEISELVAANSIYLSVTDVAKLLHVKPDGLRAATEQGKCPFGFAWRLGNRCGYKIPTLTFYTWYTGAVLT